MKLFCALSFLLVIQVLLNGCGKGGSPVITNNAKSRATEPSATANALPDRLSLSQATAAVCQEIFRLTPDMNASADFPLKELTTSDVWDRLHVQVFAVTSGVCQDEAFIIRDGRAFLLGTSFGGSGVMSMCVADLNGDGQPKLIFSYSWGSGVHRSLVALWMGGASWVDAKPVLADYDLLVERIDDQQVEVAYGEFSPDGHFRRDGNFGTLRLSGQAAKPVLEIVLNPHLDAKIQNRIWK